MSYKLTPESLKSFYFQQQLKIKYHNFNILANNEGKTK